MKFISFVLILILALMPALASAEMPEIFKNPDDPKACEQTLIEKICTDPNNPETCRMRTSIVMCFDNQTSKIPQIKLLKLKKIADNKYDAMENTLKCDNMSQEKKKCAIQYITAQCKNPNDLVNSCSKFKMTIIHSKDVKDSMINEFFVNEPDKIVCRSITGKTYGIVSNKNTPEPSKTAQVVTGILALASLIIPPVALALGPAHDAITNVALGAGSELATTATSGVGAKISENNPPPTPTPKEENKTTQTDNSGIPRCPVQ